MKTENILGKEVSKAWLLWHFESIILNIIENSNITDKESYFNGKIDSLYEELSDELFARNVLECAENEGAIISE